MTGLDNPLGLAFGPDRALYVAEGGRGGPGPPCRVVRGVTQCYGATGAISRLRNGVQEKWLTGLPSLAPAGGNGAEAGPQDIAFQFRSIPFFGRSDAYVTIGVGGNPAITRAPLGVAGTLMGKLIKVSGSREITEIADSPRTRKPRIQPADPSTRIRSASWRSRGTSSSPTPAPTPSSRSRAAPSRPSPSSPVARTRRRSDRRSSTRCRRPPRSGPMGRSTCPS